MHNRKNKNELLKETEDKLNLGYNFVDYFLTIGTNPNIFKEKWLYESDISELNNKYKEELKPIIINKFPSNDKKLVGLDEAIILHCFPKGFEVCEFNKQPEYKIFSILLDNNNYSINYPFKYVVCLKFYESINNYKKLYDKYSEFSEFNMPKDSDDDIEENISIHIPITRSKGISLPNKCNYNDNNNDKKNDENEKKDKNEGDDDKNDKDDIYCPEPFDAGDEIFNSIYKEITHKPLKNANKNGLNNINNPNNINKNNKDIHKYRKYYIPKCICLISLYPYINELSKIIKIIYRYSLVQKQIYPLEKIINNLLIEVPTPPKGIYCVEYSLINERIILKSNQMNELHTLNIEFEKLFTIFSLNNILEIFRYLMLNAKIIIFSDEIKNLTPVILSLLSLLYPFHYPYTVVSVLHKEAYKLIDNITPVLVGINEKYNKNFLKENDIDICDFTLIINMDNQELIKMGESKDKKLPQLPNKYKNNLENKINDYIKEIKNNRKKGGRGEIAKTLQLKMRTFFLEFQIELMKDYSKYLNNNIYKHQDDGKTPLENAFKLKDFLNKIPNEYYDFYEYFLGTQMFCDFIYKRMMPRDKNEQIDILYFEEKLLKSKSESIFLNSTNYKVVKKYVAPKPLPLSEEQIYYFNNYNTRNKLLLDGIEITNRREYLANRGKSFQIVKNINNNCINHHNKSPKNLKSKNNNINNDNDNDNDFSFNNFERKTMSFHIKNIMGNKDNNININSYQRINQPLFTYYIFPKLDNEYFYQNDIKNYYIDFSIYQEIKNIDNELLSKSHLSRVEIKTNEITNYINLIWLKMWVATFYYQDKQEQEYRFFQMLNILENINQHEMGVINNLFAVLIKNQIDEDLLLLLYEKILHYKLIPSNFIFKAIRNLINNKKTKLKLKTFNLGKYIKSIEEKVKIELIESIKLRKNFRKRTLRDIYDTQIIDQKVSFLMEENCNECDKKINMIDFMINLNEINDDLLWARCPYCPCKYMPKLKIIFGTENNKNNRLISTTSIVDNVVLYSPKTLFYNMFDSAKNNYNINIEDFKTNFNPFFWNIIWYFKMKKLPFDFILPYEDNIFYYLLNGKQKALKEKQKLNISTNFKLKFSQYVKEAKDYIKTNNKKSWNKKNKLIMCRNEIEIFIPAKVISNFIMRTYSISSQISDYHSVINVNDFENASQFNLERNSFGSIMKNNSVINHKNTFNEIKFKNNFKSSMSIIKINPKRKQSYFEENLTTHSSVNHSSRGIIFVEPFNQKYNKKDSQISTISEASSSVQNRKNTNEIKILKDSKINKNDLMNNNFTRTPQTLEPINDLFEF